MEGTYINRSSKNAICVGITNERNLSSSLLKERFPVNHEGEKREDIEEQRVPESLTEHIEFKVLIRS